MNQHNTPLLFRNRQILLLWVFTIVLILSCKKDNQDPLSSNSVIHGYAILYNSYDEPYSGIKVIASGPYGQQSTLTDEKGYYIFRNVSNGTFTLEFSKIGFGTLKQYNIQVYESDTVLAKSSNLFTLPSGILPNLKNVGVDYRDRYGPPTKFISIHTSITDIEIYGLDMMLFMGTGENVDWNNATFSFPASDGNFDNENLHTIYILPDIVPFKTGEKIYIRGYPCNKDEYIEGAFDTYLGKRQYSTLNKSKSTNVVSFIMP